MILRDSGGGGIFASGGRVFRRLGAVRCPRGARRGPPAERGLGRPWRASPGVVPGALRGGVLGWCFGSSRGAAEPVVWCFLARGAVARLAAFAPVCAGLPGGLLRAAWRFWRVLGAFLVHRVFSSRVVSVQI